MHARRLALHRSIYRAALALYPAEFRREYGEPMLQLFADQLRDGRRPGRVWAATAGDLVISSIAQRWEAGMRGTNLFAALLAGAVAVTSALAITGTTDGVGGILPFAGIALGILVVIAVLARLVHRLTTRPTESTWEGSRARRHWWLYPAALVGGYYVVAASKQLIEEPKAGHVAALSVAVAFAALVAAGIVLRVRRRARAGSWMVAVAMVPALPVFWFPPAPIVALLALVGALGDGLAQRGATPSAGRMA